jgi:S-adenosylmethionine:tRNA ribosyltransferase-isomerase
MMAKQALSAKHPAWMPDVSVAQGRARRQNGRSVCLRHPDKDRTVLLVSDFDYHLPEELIAQTPLEQRDEARLLVYRNGQITHDRFSAVTDLLQAGDVLVLNNSRVIPCRLMAEKEGTKGRIEIFLLNRLDPLRWECLLKPLNRTRFGIKMTVKPGLWAVLETAHSDGGEKNIVAFNREVSCEELEETGYIPLPPYIKRDYRNYSPELREKDSRMYQTVYADRYGSVASPTAGLHFTEGLLKKIKGMGVNIAAVTLEVSLGTFKPVSADRTEEHRMHEERYSVSQDAAALINGCQGKVVAVGTTSCRVIESQFLKYGRMQAEESSTGIFITPGFAFRRVDALITNFHLPKSTLLMLVSAFAGLANIRNIYSTAVREQYRFYSFGDACWLEPGPKERTP